jgi:putative membrane protein
MIEPIIIVAIAIACTAWYMQHMWRRRRARNKALRHSAGLEVLAARYARGEITRDEYLQKRDDILASYAGTAQFGGAQVSSPSRA